MNRPRLFGCGTFMVILAVAGCDAGRRGRAASRECPTKNVKHDQTPAAALGMVHEEAGALGTGFFLIPAPEQGVDVFTVRYATDLTYDQAARRGATCFAFSFIPHRLHSLKDLSGLADRCGGSSCIGGDPGCSIPCMCSQLGLCVSPVIEVPGQTRLPRQGP